MDYLVEQTAEFKVTISELIKSLAPVQKEAGTAGNKNNKLFMEVNYIRKRLVKLGQKNYLCYSPPIVT